MVVVWGRTLVSHVVRSTPRKHFVSPSLAVLNIGTSAQLTYAMQEDFRPPHVPEPASSLSYFPYFSNSYLAVAASLNGGNVLASFVGMLSAWMKELGNLIRPH